MARPLRIEYEGALYHVTSRGNERNKVFFTKGDYEKFKEYIADAQEKYGFILHCYVLMSNHYHLLIETPQKNLARLMHHINSSYTTYTNIKRKRSGHLFQGRYKAIIVDEDHYLAELSRYIHLNPVRAKIVEAPGEYEHSSYNAYVSDVNDPILSQVKTLRLFAEDTSKAQKAYQSFVESALGEDLESPFEHVYGGGILGDEDFVNEVLGNLEEGKLNDEHIANRKALRATKHVDTVLAVVGNHVGLPVDEIMKKGSSVRNLAVYLIKKFTDAPNRQISELLGVRSTSTATKIYNGFVKELESNDELKQQVEGFEAAFSQFKARPPG